MISLSANDILGHMTGPDSPNMHAMALALDHQIADFVTFLGQQYGQGQFWVVLTADHGVAPLHATDKHLNLPAASPSNKELRTQLNKELSSRLRKPGEYVRSVSYPIVFVNSEAFPPNVSESEAEGHVADAMKSMGFLAAFTKEQMGNGELPPTPLGHLYLNSYSPYGGAWVMGVPTPFTYDATSKAIANHGAPYSYDQHVPLAFYGPAFKPGVYRDQVEPIDLAPTLAVMLGINKPTSSSGRVLTEAIAQRSRSDEPLLDHCGGETSRAEREPSVSPASRPSLDLSVNVAGIELKNPVIAASGTFGYGVEFEDIVALSRIGGFVVKGLSREPMPGNPPPRLFETAAGMLNAIGLQNIGVRAFLDEKLPLLQKIKNIAVFCNVFGHSQDEYEDVVRALNEGQGIAAYELNVSCPNTKCGGISFGSDPRMLFDVVSAVKKLATRPLIVKLSPNVTSIPDVARAAEDAGADAISLVNTFVAMAIDAETRKPRISNITAGLSGPAIKPIALRMVWEAAKTVRIPVIGIGGISTAEDVIEFMLAGASAIEVGTVNFWDPCASETLVDSLEKWCLEHRIEKISQLTGGLQTS